MWKRNHALTVRHACECVKEAFGGANRKSMKRAVMHMDPIQDK